jgi:bacteriocin biosynthesis cyclodehydratase domain-containing protein
MRVLLITVPSLGHARSVAAVARRLATTGHQVLWAANETVADVAGPAVEVCRVTPPGASEDTLDVPAASASAVDRWLLEQWFVPLAEQCLGPTVEAAREFQPDVLLVDSAALWGPLTADLVQVPWASYCPGLFLGSWERRALGEPTLPEAINWARPAVPHDDLFWVQERRLNQLRRDWALPATQNLNRLSPSLVLSFTTRDFDHGGYGLPPQVLHVGPVFGSRDDIEPYPGGEVALPGGERPLIYVTLGHVFAGRQEVREAILFDLARLDVGVIAAPGRPPEAQGLAGDGCVRPSTPVAQRKVLERAAAVVCHGGFNTVMESLCHGVPVVVVPLAADHRAIAAAVERSELGVTVDSLHPDAVAGAVARVLADDAMAARVRRFRDEVRTMSPVARAAQLLLQLGRDGSVSMPAGLARLVRLPRAPVAAARYRLTDTDGGGLAVVSMVNEHQLDATLDAAALRWLWPRLDGRQLIEELDDAWHGDSGLMPLLEWLTDRGIIREGVGLPAADGSGLQRYRDQILLFSHAETAQLLGAPSVSGEELQRRLQDAGVAVIGNGVLGSNLVRSLCLVGVGRLLIVDDAAPVDAELIASGAWYRSDQRGGHRATALVDNAVELRPDLNVSVVGSPAVLPDLGEVHLAIVAADRWSADLDDRVDAAAHRARFQWTSIRRVNWEVEVGPTVIPYQSPCSLCFWSRREAVTPGRDVLSGPWFNLAVGVDWLALESLKLLSGFGEAATVGHLMVFNPMSMSLTRHRVLRRPGCPRCAASAAEPVEAPWRPS